MIDMIYNAGLGLSAAGWWAGIAWPVIWNLIKIVVVVAPLMGAVAYLTLWERKAIGFTQIRVGPNRIGPLGLLQPIADALKLLTKEIILPTVANKGLFLLGPIMTIMPALAASMSLTRERVRQIQIEGLETLRRLLRRKGVSKDMLL